MHVDKFAFLLMFYIQLAVILYMYTLSAVYIAPP